MSFESSINLDKDYFTISLSIAIEIFNDYLKKKALNKVEIPMPIKNKIYCKFGILGEDESIEIKILEENLDYKLFDDLYRFALKNLNEAYESFKKTQEFQIFKEQVIRKEKLYEVMIEAGIIR